LGLDVNFKGYVSYGLRDRLLSVSIRSVLGLGLRLRLGSWGSDGGQSPLGFLKLQQKKVVFLVFSRKNKFSLLAPLQTLENTLVATTRKNLSDTHG